MRGKTMLNPTITTVTPTIDDSTVVRNAKASIEEQREIIENFQLDFGFSLDELPDLDLPLSVYEEELEFLAMHDEQPNWDDSTDAHDRVSDSDKRMYLEGFARF